MKLNEASLCWKYWSWHFGGNRGLFSNNFSLVIYKFMESFFKKFINKQFQCRIPSQVLELLQYSTGYPTLTCGDKRTGCGAFKMVGDLNIFVLLPIINIIYCFKSFQDIESYVSNFESPKRRSISLDISQCLQGTFVLEARAGSCL